MGQQPNLKTVPHNLEAEQALLGIILFDPQRMVDLDGQLTALEFYEPMHGVMYRCAQELARTGDLTPQAVHARMCANYAHLAGDENRRTPYEQIGGARYIAELVDRSPMCHLAGHFAGLIREASDKRNLIDVADRLRMDAMGPDPLDKAITHAEWGLRNIAGGMLTTETWEGPDVLCNATEDIVAGRGGPMYQPTGIDIWDEQVGGLQLARMNILGARSRMGKSTLAAIVAVNIAMSGKGVGYFSLEMDRRELGLRMACAAAFRRGQPDNPAYYDAVRNRLTPAAAQRIIAGAQSLRGKPLMFDQRPSLKPHQIESAMVRALRKWEKDGVEPGCFILDHLMIVDPDEESGNKVVDMTNISKAGRRLSLQTGVPLLALAQLNRNVDARSVTDKDPQLADLGWSGALEQDAAQVMFLTRPYEYMKEPPPKATDLEASDFYLKKEYWRDKAKLIPAKNRMGPTGEAMEIGFDLACNACWSLSNAKS